MSENGKISVIRAGAGFREQLAPHFVVDEQRSKEPPLLFLGAVHHDGRCTHAVADASAHQGNTCVGDATVDQELQLGRQTEAAVAHRKVHECQTDVELRAIEGTARCVGEVL